MEKNYILTIFNLKYKFSFKSKHFIIFTDIYFTKRIFRIFNNSDICAYREYKYIYDIYDISDVCD